jgi:hypothetical protein
MPGCGAGYGTRPLALLQLHPRLDSGRTKIIDAQHVADAGRASVGFIGSENPIRRFCVSGFLLPSAKILRQQRGHRKRSLRFL